jgi:ribosomal protein S18 acetylase RimI-like enzyme
VAAWQLRPAARDDIDAVLELWKRAEASPSPTDTPEALQILIDGWPGALILAEQDGMLIGSIIASFDGWRGNLYRLVVDTAQRRRGVGRALVQAGEEHMRSLGASRVTALVESDHPLAVGFWEAGPYRLHEVMRRYFNRL